jgi:uncharacterized protein (TIGR00369 family)
MTNFFNDWVVSGNPPRIAQAIGIRLVQCGDERAVMEFTAGPEHENPLGSLHGGILCYLADTAMGFSWLSGLKPGESFTAVEVKFNFLRPVKHGRVVAEASVVRRGRTLGYVECDVKDDAGRLVAKASGTFMVLRG